jgi:ribosomal protein S13
MDTKLSKVLKLINDLTKQELMTLNQAVVSLIKTQHDVDFAQASIIFSKGNIVSYIDSSGIRVHGIVTKKNPKTIQVTTENNYYVNIPASYLRLEKNLRRDY